MLLSSRESRCRKSSERHLTFPHVHLGQDNNAEVTVDRIHFLVTVHDEYHEALTFCTFTKLLIHSRREGTWIHS